MAYYMQGDYYRGARRGDYYRGDPGFLSFLGKIAKSAVSLIPGVGPSIAGLIPEARPAISAGTAILQKTGPIVTALKKPSRLTRLGGVTLAGGALGAGALLGRSGALGRVGGGAKRRRMNVCNPRALRRSIRRTQGFAKLAMRTIHLVHPKKKVRFGGFRKRRAKR